MPQHAAAQSKGVSVPFADSPTMPAHVCGPCKNLKQGFAGSENSSQGSGFLLSVVYVAPNPRFAIELRLQTRAARHK
jgi:hypothetical protein